MIRTVKWVPAAATAIATAAAAALVFLPPIRAAADPCRPLLSQMDSGPRQTFWGLAPVSPSTAWVVGFTRGTGGVARPLATRWRGDRLHAEPLVTSRGTLYAVAVGSWRNAWAVGGSRGLPIIERWDGARWHVVDTARLGRGELHGAKLVDGHLWVVGDRGIYDWHARRWVLRGGAQFVSLYAGPGGTDVWATVEPRFGISDRPTRVLHWERRQWVPIYFPTSYVSSIAPHQVRESWALGRRSYYADRGGQTLVRWDGRAWKRVALRPSAVDIAATDDARYVIDREPSWTLERWKANQEQVTLLPIGGAITAFTAQRDTAWVATMGRVVRVQYACRD